MAHPTGERLRCDECGAEIVFVKACRCSEQEPKPHSHICCGKEMRSVGLGGSVHPSQPEPRH